MADMTTPDVWPLVAGYALLAALLLLVLLRAPADWRLKGALVALSMGFAALGDQAWRDLQGWPATQLPPEDMRVLATHIVEPNRQTGDPGAIYVWGVADMTPRAFRLPYSPPLHDDADNAQRSHRRGRPVVVRHAEQPAAAQSSTPGRASGIRLTELKQRRLPPKPRSTSDSANR